jgi:hypothetical protein
MDQIECVQNGNDSAEALSHFGDIGDHSHGCFGEIDWEKDSVERQHNWFIR